MSRCFLLIKDQSIENVKFAIIIIECDYTSHDEAAAKILL